MMMEFSAKEREEFTSVVDKLAKDCEAMKGKVEDIKAKLMEDDLPTSKGMSFLQVKNHLLLNYSTNLMFFTLLKTQSPEKVENHPVFKQLVRIRTIMERTRPLDRKLKYQVDKMLKMAVSNSVEQNSALSFAPNPKGMASIEAGAASASEEELEEVGDSDNDSSSEKQLRNEKRKIRSTENKSDNNDGIYRAPRLASVPYEEEERQKDRQLKIDERNRKRMQKSTILSELREEFSERPEEIRGAGAGNKGYDKQLAREEKERLDFEESRFVRVVQSKKDKIRNRMRERDSITADGIGNIDNFAGVKDALNLDKDGRDNFMHLADARLNASVNSKKGKRTGGIFAHVNVEKTPKRQKRGSSNNLNSSKQPRILNKSSSNGDSTPAPTKKKKVAFNSVFGNF